MATSPVGVPEPDKGATLALNVTGVPCSIDVAERESVVVVGRNETLFQFATNTLASTDPRPVARS